MKLNLVPEKVIPARHEVRFWEDRQHADLLSYPEPWVTDFAEDVKAWLEENDPDWSVTFDRGDFGEGMAEVILALSSEEIARRFHERWNQGRCVSVGYTNCPNMKPVREMEYSCEVCGESMKMLRLAEWQQKMQSIEKDASQGDEDDLS